MVHQFMKWLLQVAKWLIECIEWALVSGQMIGTNSVWASKTKGLGVSEVPLCLCPHTSISDGWLHCKQLCCHLAFTTVFKNLLSPLPFPKFSFLNFFGQEKNWKYQWLTKTRSSPENSENFISGDISWIWSSTRPMLTWCHQTLQTSPGEVVASKDWASGIVRISLVLVLFCILLAELASFSLVN